MLLINDPRPDFKNLLSCLNVYLLNADASFGEKLHSNRILVYLWKRNDLLYDSGKAIENLQFIKQAIWGEGHQSL